MIFQGCSPKEAIEFLDKELGLGLNKDENEKIFHVLNKLILKYKFVIYF
jgi:hypothetical protein